MKIQKRMVCISGFISMIISALVTIVFDVVSGSRWSLEIPGNPYMADRIVENLFLYFGIQSILCMFFCGCSYFMRKKLTLKGCLFTFLYYIVVSLVGMLVFVYIGEWFGR